MEEQVLLEKKNDDYTPNLMGREGDKGPSVPSNIYAEAAPKFDSTKAYQWKPEDKFTISGAELNFLHNSLFSVFNNNLPQGAMYLMLNECLKVARGIVQKGVEAGVILPAPEPDPQVNQSN